ncbi:hypothetical protein REJ26_004373 [Providencia stuartii]|uniref:hypothetical protein n=1 Tax=Providencia sp. 2023EL-00965 TaxID=3084975 RepID=UPI0027FDE663|nr:hypothetical protein [Providencia sp. 2023EL-00965]ELR5302502.1 hypothetical protein [Providencia stuartii]MDW7590970.1 hypothetical protein [Providencia sp. 2023EL-00965]
MRDAPKKFKEWSFIFKLSNSWSQKDKIRLLFTKISDRKYFFIDGTIVLIHQRTIGVATEENEKIRKKSGGNSTRIHLVVDSCGYLVNKVVATIMLTSKP